MPSSPFRFEALCEHTLPLLHGWLQRPHVSAWWQPVPTLQALREDYLLPQGPGDTHAFIAFRHDEPIGFIQRYVVLGAGDGWWEDETDPGARGIDQFLADESALGQGLGRAMIRSFVEQLFRDPQVTVVQTDPHPDNERAIRCYRAAGFVPEGRIRTPDGPALLMKCTRTSLMWPPNR